MARLRHGTLRSDRTTKCANERPNVETNGDLTSPTISSGSEPVAVRVNDAISVNSDGQESWAELSEPGSDEESSAPGEGRVRSL